MILFRKMFRPLMALLLIACLATNCVGSRQDQFGYAAMTGNVAMARQNIAPGYVNMKITESNGQKSVPIQYSIIQRNKPMASFLVQNGCQRTINSQNLVYYSAANGYDDMANYFVDLGIASRSEISRAHRDRAAAQRRSEQGALIALGLLAALIGSGGGSSSHSDRCDICGTDLNGYSTGQGLCQVCMGGMLYSH